MKIPRTRRLMSSKYNSNRRTKRRKTEAKRAKKIRMRKQRVRYLHKIKTAKIKRNNKQQQKRKW